MQEWRSDIPLPSNREWLDDPTLELGRNANNPRRHKQPYKDIAVARSRVRDNKKPNTHDQIISETASRITTEFGQWTHIPIIKTS